MIIKITNVNIVTTIVQLKASLFWMTVVMTFVLMLMVNYFSVCSQLLKTCASFVSKLIISMKYHWRIWPHATMAAARY